MILADLIAGRANPWAEVFDATRIKPAAGAKTFLSENLGVGASWSKATSRAASARSRRCRQAPPRCSSSAASARPRSATSRARSTRSRRCAPTSTVSWAGIRSTGPGTAPATARASRPTAASSTAPRPSPWSAASRPDTAAGTTRAGGAGHGPGTADKVAVITGGSVGIGLAVARDSRPRAPTSSWSRATATAPPSSRASSRRVRVAPIAVACDVATAEDCDALDRRGEQRVRRRRHPDQQRRHRLERDHPGGARRQVAVLLGPARHGGGAAGARPGPA